jgi:phosphomannomutase
MFGKTLPALPTRDAVLPVLGILLLSIRENQPVSGLLAVLPQRFTASGRIRNFPTEESAEILAALQDAAAVENVFGDRFGQVQSIDRTDGLRITFQTLEILHLRPSGNAPEFRCYNEAASQERAQEMQRQSMDVLLRLKAS